MRKFTLSDEQDAKFKRWHKKLKKKYGEGLYTFSFTPCGIGDSIEVLSQNTGKVLSLTDLDNF